MAMVFTLVSQLQESIQDLVSTRIKRREQEGADAAKREVEKEEARTRGTPVTLTSFVGWKQKFDQERLRSAAREDEEKMKAMSPKEREEYKKNKLKLTGMIILRVMQDVVYHAMPKQADKYSSAVRSLMRKTLQMKVVCP